MIDVSSFWKSSQFQDATLLLSPDRLLLEEHRLMLLAARKSPLHTRDTSEVLLSGSFNNKAASAGRGQVVMIPVHRIVLSAGSDYFKTAISTLIGDRVNDFGEWGSFQNPIIVLLEDDIDAAQEVLHFLYTETLGSIYRTPPRLMQMLLVADRWMIPKCVSACCRALVALPSLTLKFDHVLAIYAPGGGPIPPSLLDAKDFKLVLETAVSKLLQYFGDVPTVVASPTLTKNLLQLPPSAILAMLGSDTLMTNCEDSVLMLLSWWLQGDVGKYITCDSDIWFELTKTIRYSRLSPTYLVQALSLIPHLSPTPTQLSDLQEFQAVLSKSMLHLNNLETACPADWFKPTRPLPISSFCDQTTVALTLNISSKDLSQHINALKGAEPEPTSFSSSVDFKGFVITLSFASDCVNIDPSEDVIVGDFVVSLCACARLPASSSVTDLPRGIISSAKINLHSSLPGQHLMSYAIPKRFYSVNRGLPNFHQVVSHLPGNPRDLAWWDPFMIDGLVRITAQFKDERTY